MKSLCSLLLPALALSALPAISAKNCTIDCLHGTKCVQGQANFTWHPTRPESNEPFDFSKEISRDGYHCGCPHGLTGLRCGRKYESCDDGEHVCFNGGQCIATLKDIYQNDQLYCDCPATTDANGGIVKYSGKYCEVEIKQSGSRCDDGEKMCKNGGTCKKVVDEVQPCECAEGFVGRHCEFYQPSVPDCALKCQNGGECRLGTKKESKHFNVDATSGGANQTVTVVHKDFQFCECPHGFSGVKCEQAESQCGDIQCKHGAACITVQNSDTKKLTYHCDCNEVNQKQKQSGSDVFFAGKRCEVVSTDICHYDDMKTKQAVFCTNDGICPKEPHGPCTCDEGYKGSHCEYTVEEEKTEEHAKCHLQCKNGGTCQKGTNKDPKTQQMLAVAGEHLSQMSINQTHTDDFEHCSCPDGFVGLECEYEYIPCGEEFSHPCFHGSECVMVKGVPTCACDNADTLSAGIYCQHEANEICTLENPAEIKEKTGNLGFCVNGGVCVNDKNDQTVCRCHTEFEGPHCEYLKKTAAASTNEKIIIEEEGLSGGAKVAIFLAVFCSLGALLIGILALMRSTKKLEEDCPALYPDLTDSVAIDDMSLRSAPPVDPDSSEGVVVDVGPEKDFEGNELKDVEFL